MLIVREQCRILRIIPTDRQTEQLLEHTASLIDLIKNYTVITGIGAYQVPEITRYVQCTGCRPACMIVIQCGNGLYLVKFR